jgi:hypothetical protein
MFVNIVRCAERIGNSGRNFKKYLFFVVLVYKNKTKKTTTPTIVYTATPLPGDGGGVNVEILQH